MIIILSIMVFAVSLVGYVVYKFFSFAREQRQTISTNILAMQDPETFTMVGLILAMTCQSEPDTSSTSYVNKNDQSYLHDLLMPLMKNFKSPYNYLVIDSDLAIIEFAGGFYHYGYRMELDKNHLSQTTNRWELWVWKDDCPYCKLQVFELPKEQCFTKEQFKLIHEQGFVDYSQLPKPVFIQTIAPNGRVGIDIDQNGKPLSESGQPLQTSGEQIQ